MERESNPSSRCADPDAASTVIQLKMDYIQFVLRMRLEKNNNHQ